MKYIVAEGAAFVAGGRVYEPGEAIDESVFGKDALALALKPSERFPNGKLLDKAKVDAEFKAAQEKIQWEADKTKKDQETQAAREAADRKLTLAKAQAATKTQAAQKAQNTADAKKAKFEEAKALAEAAEKEANTKEELFSKAQEAAQKAAADLENAPQDKAAQNAAQKANESVETARAAYEAALAVFNDADAAALEKEDAYLLVQTVADSLKAESDKAVKEAAK